MLLLQNGAQPPGFEVTSRFSWVTGTIVEERIVCLFSPFDVLPKVQPAELPHEPYPGATAIIGRVFDATDTTYKFYWFLSLLERALPLIILFRGVLSPTIWSGTWSRRVGPLTQVNLTVSRASLTIWTFTSMLTTTLSRSSDDRSRVLIPRKSDLSTRSSINTPPLPAALISML
jgi:hypothetical protein